MALLFQAGSGDCITLQRRGTLGHSGVAEHLVKLESSAIRAPGHVVLLTRSRWGGGGRVIFQLDEKDASNCQTCQKDETLTPSLVPGHIELGVIQFRHVQALSFS